MENELVFITKEDLLKDRLLNEIVATQKVDDFLNQVNAFNEKIKKAEDEFRKSLLELMKENGVQNIKTDKYTISLVIPKSSVVFDKEKFEEENPFEAADYITFKNSTSVDTERLIKENPELAKKYVVIHQESTVDLANLEKKEKALYDKYATIIPSTKEIGLRIVANTSKTKKA